ncbi:MAG: AraC family transcriptional regulator [Burkholderiaceae bacterium]
MNHGSSIHVIAAIEGLEIIETRGLRHAFGRHRHDRYVIGLTTHGVQQFNYRGAARTCDRGQAFILHPDEPHDGRPGTGDGYGYRAAYIAPELVRQALGAGDAPFVAQPVCTRPALIAALGELLTVNADDAALALASGIQRLADALAESSDGPRRRVPRSDQGLARRIGDDLAAHWRSGISITVLESRHRISRFAMTRLFRRHYGVSPQRFLIMRRLDHARRMIERGSPLADAALASGFADQSHMSRQFMQAFGISPGRWRRLYTNSIPPSSSTDCPVMPLASGEAR